MSPVLARRGLLAGLGAALAAPAIIRTPGLLMAVRPVPVPYGITVIPGGLIKASSIMVRTLVAPDWEAFFQRFDGSTRVTYFGMVPRTVRAA